MNSSEHPNLIPVKCSTVDEMRVLSQQMRELCLVDIDHVDEYVASPTQEAALQRAKVVNDDIIASGHLRFIHYQPDGRLVNVVYTLLDPENGKKEWNLSMSHATLAGPKRVDDDLATMICEAFLGNDYQEVDPKAFWKNVRHFTMPA